jgi:uncharacterized phage-associated protein
VCLRFLSDDAKGPMPYSAITVANEFLRLGAAEAAVRRISPLQIIKLVYMANGWSLALLDRPLTFESAEAWTYGPVMPQLYRAVRHFRADPIDGTIEGAFDAGTLGVEDNRLISAVYRAYGTLSGTQLSNMTHLPGTPWSETWANGAGQNLPIDAALIKQHYIELAKRMQA